jgi:dihydrofolate reductase
MSKVICDMGMSIDGYVAGPNQSRENPLGEGAETVLHSWMFDEPEAHRAQIDAIVDAGAFIMGRNMFGPIRGEWDEEWNGWWGEDPPYHGPVFVLTNYAREPVEMQGGTTFHFVTDGIESALAQAREAAGERNVSVAGGASTVNQYLAIGAIDELRLHIAPLVFGRGERLFEGMRDITLEPVDVTGNARVTHLTYRVMR